MPVGEGQRAAVLFGDGAGEGETKPGATGLGVARRFAAGERFEHPGDVLRGDAGAGVGDTDHRRMALAHQGYIGLATIAQRVADQVAQRAADPGGAQRQDDPRGLAQFDRIAHVLVFLDHRGDQRRQFGRFARVPGPADPGERQDVVQRPGDVFDRAGHAVALVIVLDRFDPDPERGQRGFEIVADRAEHHVLFIEQRDDAAFHRIVRGDQAGDVLWPLRFELVRFKLAGGIARIGKAFKPCGQRRQRPGNPAEQQPDRADQQRVD